jgi:CRISPR-associated protein Csm1
MSVPFFLQGKLAGIPEFLRQEENFIGRSHWVALLSEVLPRAVLAELGLSTMLLGSSGGGQFLVILPEENLPAANDLLSRAAAEIAQLSGGTLRLIWASTENLGDWLDIRKRLNESLQQARSAPLARSGWPEAESAEEPAADPETYFAGEIQWGVRQADAVAWSPETPGRVLLQGKHQWAIGAAADAIPFARHAALEDSGEPATAAALAARSQGRKAWGVLRGDVDHFGIRYRKVPSIEEHIQLSILYKQFFAGELEVLCSMPEFWRKVTVLYSGGDDFGVYGSWDALIPFARELQRLFHRFAEENLKDFPGPEGKTVTMALSLAPHEDAPLARVFEDAGQRLEAAKSADKDCIWLLGRTLEWKQFGEAAELKESLGRLVEEFRVSPAYLDDICGIYRETPVKLSRRQARRSGAEKPWRYYRRITRILESRGGGRFREREFEKASSGVIADLIGRSAGYLKLRPAGRVALEWARLSAEN